MEKRIAGIFLMIGLVLNCVVMAQKSSYVVPPPKDAARYIEVDDSDHDFGNIQFKRPVDYAVHIQNISTDTITLTNVQVSCGCTIPQWKRGPYAPRDTFSISIAFNGYAEGKFTRSLTLLFNDRNKNNIVKVLSFRGVGYEKLPIAADNSKDDGSDYYDNVDATANIRTHLKKVITDGRFLRYSATKIR